MEDRSHENNKVEIGGLFVDLQLEVSDLLIHGLLEYSSLVVLELLLGDAAAAVEDVDKPDPEGIEDEIVGEEGGDIPVPDWGEGGVKVKLGHFEEVLYIAGDDGDEGYIAAGLEAEYIRIYKHWQDYTVEQEEDGEYAGL